MIVNAELAEPAAQAQVGVRQDRGAERSPEPPGEGHVDPDHLPGRDPRVVEPGQGTTSARLEQPVRLGAPREEVALTPLDGQPGRRPVQGLEEGVTGEPVRLFQRLGDVPPHVHEHAAEVENDARGRANRG